eukprot:m.135932 g.135932  ORF g.135932 m.135932 type:complete len:71 (-) comp9897_c0_seq1:49-261(-)
MATGSFLSILAVGLSLLLLPLLPLLLYFVFSSLAGCSWHAGERPLFDFVGLCRRSFRCREPEVRACKTTF